MIQVGIKKRSGVKNTKGGKPNGNPSEVLLTVLSGNSMKVDFTIGSTNHDGHHIYMSSDSGVTYSNIGSVTGSTATFTKNDLLPTTTYYVKVAAYKGNVISDFSFPVYDATYPVDYTYNVDKFCLDGTIIDILGTKYLKDKSPNARNFLIDNYDFKSGIVGFPYKTKATISAPAGDADLIAWDTNHLFYDINGTPRQLPPTAFFQNIDYLNKVYSRHFSMMLGANDIEIFEPRIGYIVGYANAKTGSGATSCNTYYNVPTEDVNAKWVDVNASAGGNGSKATPYNSIESAYKACASGTTFYIKTGVYLEEYNNTSIRYFYADKSGEYTFKGLGYVEMKTVSTSFVLRIVNGTTNWYNINFNGEGNTSNVIDSFAGSSNNCYVYKSKIWNSSSSVINTTANANVNYYKFSQCIIDSPSYSAITRDGCEIVESYINCPIYAHVYKYNRVESTFKDVSLVMSVSDNIICSYNHGNIKCGLIDSLVKGYIKYNEFEYTEHVSAVNNVKIVSISGLSAADSEIYANKFSCNNTTLNRALYFIYVDAPTPKFLENIIYCKSTNNAYGIFVPTNASFTTAKCSFVRNRVHMNIYDGVMVQLGGEAALAGKVNESEFIGNRIIGFRLEHPTQTGTCHAVLFSGGIDFDIRRNFVSHSQLGIVVKTGDSAQSYTKNGLGSNVFSDNVTYDIWIRGVKNLYISNSSHINNDTLKIAIDENTPLPGDQFSEQVKVYNSLLSNSNIIMDAHALANGCEGINNRYLSISAEHPYPVNPDNNGTVMEAFFKDGLDISTNWGDENTPPTIVTKSQASNGTWQLGAYVN